MNFQPLFSIPFLASRWEKDFQDFQSSPEAAVLLERLQEQAKLLVPRLISRLFCAIDDKGAVYLDNVDVGGISVSDAKDLPYLAAFLNSPVCNFIWRRISKPFQNDYRSANKQFIAPLPIPRTSKEDKIEVARMARELQRQHTLRRDLIAKFSRRLQGDQTLTDKRKETWLCADDAKMAEKYAAWAVLLRPGATFSVEHSDDELRLKIDGMVALELYDEPETPFIAAQWRQALRDVNVTESFRAKKLADLLVKMRKSDHAELKKRLIELDTEITQTDTAIATAEAVLNALVYQLYGLDAEEIKLVEGAS
jgi:hypothetical protein